MTKTLILTKHEDGKFEIAGNAIDIVDRVGIVEAARIIVRCELITQYKHLTDTVKESGIIKE